MANDWDKLLGPGKLVTFAKKDMLGKGTIKQGNK